MCGKDKDKEVISSETVKLNVGGYLFNPKVSTLTKCESLLKSMMKGEESVLMKEGYIFIDRDGKYFERLLNYLQDGKVSLNESDEEIKEFLTEAKYYRISSLISLCQKVLKERNIQNIIKLNVGGTYFTTTKYTLTKCESFLKKIIEEDHKTLIDAEGNVFIDRCGKHFGKILNYLCDGTIRFPKSAKEINELLAEAKFYGFSELINECEKAMKEQNKEENKEENSKDIITLNVGGHLFTTTASTLKKKPSNFLNSAIKYDKHGNIFIDCTPKIFEQILNYLRFDEIHCSTEDELILLMKAAHQFEIDDLTEKLIERHLGEKCRPWPGFK